jgi:hypothetical protein
LYVNVPPPARIIHELQGGVEQTVVLRIFPIRASRPARSQHTACHRFLHHAEIITITGRSYRLRNQGRQEEEPKENGQANKEGKRSRKDSAESPSVE